MIPKVIHCCWFSGGTKDALANKCRDSWERTLTSRNYEPEIWRIREWTVNDLENCGVKIPSFVREAIAREKWAFAADWARFAVLYLEGGVYFDYDFELLSPIDDLVSEGAFVAGQWMVDGTVSMEPAIMALEKGSAIARAMLDYYSSAEFDGKTTVGNVLSDMAKVKGEQWKIRVLSPEVFSPIDVNGICRRTAETRGIHHYAMSWVSPWRKLLRWICWHGGRGFVDVVVSIKRALYRL